MTTWILSPHLDDAILSCFGEILDGARVVTVYAGIPAANAPRSGWDKACGYADPREHVRARRAEDDLVMRSFGVRSEQWGFVEYPHRAYGPRPSILDLTRLLREATEPDDEIWAPISLLSPSPHPDHVDVRYAAEASGRRTRLYGDLPHCLKQVGEWPGVVAPGGPEIPPAWQRAASETTYSDLAVRDLPLNEREAKAAAMRAYATQFRPLGRLRDAPSRRVLRRPEVYGIEASWGAE